MSLRSKIGFTIFAVSTTASLIGVGQGFVEMKNELGDLIDDMYNDQFKEPNTRPRPIVSKVYHTKNFIGRHKVAIAVAVTATATLKLHKSVVNQYNEFLEAKGLLDEYWLWPGDEGLVVLA